MHKKLCQAKKISFKSLVCLQAILLALLAVLIINTKAAQAGTTPAISSAVIKTSGTSTIIQVNFNVRVFAASDGTGNLATADFTFVDAASPWAEIAWVSHTAGDDFAMVGISGPVTTSDTIAAANNASIYTVGGSLKQTAAAITVDSTVPAITAVEYLAGNTNKTVLVTFSEPVYGTAPAHADHDGAITATADYLYTDTSGAGAASISSLSQSVGSKYVRIVLNATPVTGDELDTINAVASSVYDAVGNTAAATAWRMNDNTNTRPRVSSITVTEAKKNMKVVFTEGVTDETGAALAIGDLSWWDATAVAATDAFATVTHTAGSDTVYLYDADGFDVDADGLEIQASKVMDGAGNFAATATGAPGTSGSIRLDGNASYVPYAITAVNSDVTAPTISSITRGTDKKMVKIVFSEGVTDETGAALAVGDIQVNDSGVGQDVAADVIVHTAGSDTVVVYFAAAFDVSRDMIEFEADKIYDVSGNGFSAAEVKYTLGTLATADTTAPTISAITHNAGSTKCATVTFSEIVSDETAAALGTGDLKFFDESAADASTAFATVTHVAGTASAFVCASVNLELTDEIEIVASKVTDRAGNFAAATTADGATVALGSINAGTPDTTAPTISAIYHNAGNTKYATVVFSEGVYDLDDAGDLDTTDIKLWDNAVESAWTSVTHTAGGTTVFLFYTTANLVAADDDIQIMATKILDRAGNAAAATTAGGTGLAAGEINAGTADTTAATITGITHNAGNTKYATVTFSEAVYDADDRGDLDTADIKLWDATVDTAFTAITHAAGGTSVFAFYTTAVLVAADDDIQIVATKVLDRAGNASAATVAGGTGLAAGEIAAGTADTTVPTISAIYSGTDKNIISATISEAAYDADASILDTNTFTFYDTSDAGSETGGAFGTVYQAEAGTNVIMYVAGGLETLADMLEVVASKVYDPAGNPAAAEPLGFSTSITADTTPIDSQADVTSVTLKAGGKIAVLTFNEGVIDSDGTALDVSDIRVDNNDAGIANSAVITHTAGSATVTIQFHATNTWVVAEDDIGINTGVTDLAGNQVVSEIETRVNAFTGYSTADATAPTVSAIYTSSVGANYDFLYIVFSEAVYDETGAALDAGSITWNDVGGAGTGQSLDTYTHTAGTTTIRLKETSLAIADPDTIEFVTGKICDATGNCNAAITSVAITASSIILDANQSAPSISAVLATKGDTKMLVTFNEPVFTSSDGTGAVVLADLTYTDTTETLATVTASHTAANPWALLTRSVAIAAGDMNSDTLAAASATAIYDNNGIAMATTTVVTDDTINPTLVTGATMDVDADGLIDYYKLTFSEAIDESAATGFSTGALGTTMGTEVAVGGDARYGTNAVLLDDTATVGGETNTDDDTILYVKFAQESNDATDIAQGDTDVKPSLTTSSATFQDFGSTPNTLANVAAAALTESDSAKPSIFATATKGIGSSTKLVIAFSEGVYSTNATSGALAYTDFTYTDASSSDAASISATAPAHVAGQRKAVITLNADLNIATDTYVDTVAAATAAAASVWDVAGNAAPTTAYTFQMITGDKTLTLQPGWNVVSTPDHLAALEFSNAGTGITFYSLSGSTWSSVTATPTYVTPLTGYFVNNANSANVSMYLGYSAMETSPVNNQVTKTLAAGWNTMGASLDDATNANVNAVLGGSTTDYSTVIDFTNRDFAASEAASWTYTDGTQKSSTAISADTGNPDLAETVGYGIYATTSKIISGTTDN